MTTNKFSTGAFVFTRARGLQPRDSDDLHPLASQHGLPASIIPTYAGDRAAAGRAISQTSAGLYREGFLLRPIRRTSSEVVYGIVREQQDEDRLDHEHEATVSWAAEPDATVQGDHPIARRVADAYASLRGNIVAEDWSSTITAFLEQHDAARIRGDGRVYWVPPQRVDAVKQLGAFLSEVGIDLILCELEPEVRTVVEQVAHESIEDQLKKLQEEVAKFDPKTKPSTLSKRLDIVNTLKARANLYREALGVGVEHAEQVLDVLEAKVQAMFELRKNTIVHRDGTISGPATMAPSALSPEPTPEPGEQATAPSDMTLKFAGATFTPAASDDPSILTFISDDQSAKTTAQALESMGIAGSWQQAGPVQVNIKNSGPPGAAVSISLRLPDDLSLHASGPHLAGLGIELLA
jgi:hypothetical protein